MNMNMNFPQYLENFANRHQDKRKMLWNVFRVFVLLTIVSFAVFGSDQGNLSFIPAVSMVATIHSLLVAVFIWLFEERMSEETIYKTTTVMAVVWEWYKALGYVVFFLMLLFMEGLFIVAIFKSQA